MAKITIFSTKGASKRVHETSVTTWGELKTEIAEHYDFSNLQATENVNRTDLSAPSANLPAGDFTLFLRPIKTKSGSLSYTEAREIIKEDEELQKYIKDTYGRNYTNLPTSTLNEAIENMYDDSGFEDEDDDDNYFESVEEEDENEDIENLEEKVQELISKLEVFLYNTLPSIQDKLTALKTQHVAVDEEIERLQREAREIFGE